MDSAGLKVKKRKTEEERRKFQSSWELKYFFVELDNAAMCLVCRKKIQVFKQYNIKNHYKSLHSTPDTFTSENREEKLKKLKVNFSGEQGLFTTIRKNESASVQTSFAISELIAQDSKPFTEGEFVKKCL